MGAFRNPNFVAEFAYRTKWNYYQLRCLQEEDNAKRVLLQNTLDKLEAEMKEHEYCLEDFYEITQLINSTIGLLIFPEQNGYENISDDPTQLPIQFPTLAKCTIGDPEFYSNYEYKREKESLSAKNILRHMRNAAAHNEIGIIPENGRLENGEEAIKKVRFHDFYRDKNYEFIMTVKVEDLEDLLMEICDVLLKESR